MRMLMVVALAVMMMVVAGCVPSRLSVRQDGVIAFAGEQHFVYVYDGRTQEVKRISMPEKDRMVMLSAEWSPDGKRLLVLELDNGEGGQNGCWTVDADGKNSKEVETSVVVAHWTPDGKGVTLAVCEEMLTLFVMETGTGKREKLLENALPGFAWDPQAEKLAGFERAEKSPAGFSNASLSIEPGKAQLVIVDHHGKEKTLVAPVEYVDFPWVTWSKDGKTVIFTASTEKVPEGLLEMAKDEQKKVRTSVGLYALDVKSGKSSRLTEKNIGYAEYSPNGKQILFVEVLKDGKTQVGVMNADGTGAKVLDEGKALNEADEQFGAGGYQPVWLSGTRVQYYKDDPDDERNPAWWAIDIDGKNKEDLGAKIKKLMEALPKEEPQKPAEPAK